MKKISYIVVSIFAALLVALPSYAENTVQVSGELAPSLFYFDYFKGPGEEKTHFLERYDYKKGFSGDRRSDFYLDVDINLKVEDNNRDLLVIEREGFGLYNQRGRLKINTDKIGFYSSYSYFRTATGGIDYLYSPNQITGGTDIAYPLENNAGYVRQFNDDSNQTLYKISRTNYAAGFYLKPSLFGNIGSISVDYDGYTRKGNQFAEYILGGSDLQGTNFVLQRWRAYDRQINENNNSASLDLNISPQDLFVFTYDLTVEKFQNNAKETTLGDIALLNGWPFVDPGDGSIFVNGIARANIPLHFIPDTSMIRHGFKITKNIGDRAVIGAGYGISILEQDTFTERQQDAGYNTGKITTDTGYITANVNASSLLGLGAFVKYYKRDNDSSFPVPGFIDPQTGERLTAPRIDRIKSVKYGLEANLYPRALRSTITAGWSHEDKDRNLTFGQVFPYIPPQRTLYREDTSSDEIYLKLVSRLAKGVTLRITPSHTWANKTGLISEPSRQTNIKTSLSYAAPEMSGLLITGFYNFRDKENDKNFFVDGTPPAFAGDSHNQDIKHGLNSAGTTVSINPVAKLNTSLTYMWNQDDVDSHYFSTNVRRFQNANVLFAVRDRQNYKIETHTLSVGADYHAYSYLILSGSYSFSNSKGDTASGIAKDELPDVDARINNTLHTLSLGAVYEIKKTISLRAGYIYDYYKDKVFGDLTGGVNTFMAGIIYRF